MNPSFGILWWVVIGGVAGWAASVLAGGTGRSIFANLGLGVAGALVGGFIAQRFFHDRLGDNSLYVSFGIALLGSLLVLGVWRLLVGRRPAFSRSN